VRSIASPSSSNVWTLSCDTRRTDDMIHWQEAHRLLMPPTNSDPYIDLQPVKGIVVYV